MKISNGIIIKMKLRNLLTKFKMKKIKLYIATSINGYIAREDGSIDWLENIPKLEDNDYGYKEFYNSIGTTIMGNATYQQLLSWGIDFPYPDKKNYVVTSKTKYQNTNYVDFISKNHFEFISELRKQHGSDIWLVGGGYLNTMMLNAGLIDEIIQDYNTVLIAAAGNTCLYGATIR